MSLRNIVFDCDGVILESMDIKTKTMKRIGDEFSPEYGPDIGDQLARYHQLHGGVSRNVKFEWLFETIVGRSITDAEMRDLSKKFVDISLDEVAHSELVSGAEDVLKHWHGRVPLFVASGAPEEELRYLLRLRGLEGYFEGIYGSPPAKSLILHTILRQTGAHAADCVMIGDSSTDMYAAETVGMRFYGRGGYFAHYGYPWHEDLTRLNQTLEQWHNEY